MSEDLRAQFEADCFGYYMRLKAGGWSHPDEGDPTPEALFWRREDNPEMYGVHQIEAAWQGYKMHAGRVAPAVAYEAEHSHGGKTLHPACDYALIYWDTCLAVRPLVYAAAPADPMAQQTGEPT